MRTWPFSELPLSSRRSPQRSQPRSSERRPRRSRSRPDNTVEPRINGTPKVGQVQRANRGTWTGTPPISYEYRWYRCQGAGAPDASDCQRISNASDNTYVARQGDSGFRLRVRVVGRNADGQDTATSNPTAVITSAGPTNTREPTISGTATVGNTLQANRGEWTGQQPITYSFAWQRCSAQGDNCSEIPGANDTEYEVRRRRQQAGRSVSASPHGTIAVRTPRSRTRPVSSAAVSLLRHLATRSRSATSKPQAIASSSRR